MSATQRLEVETTGGLLGAEVRGLDLAGPLTAELAGRIRELVNEHLVVVFPEQFASAQQQRDFARLFGPIYQTPYDPLVDASISGVTLHRSEDGYRADVWHSDGQNRPAPNEFSTIQMVKCPRRGGDTVWSNQYAVYEALSAPLRSLLDGLTALQRSGVDPSKECEHPAVIAHPKTGRRLLYVSRHHTVRFLELCQGESRALIDYLTAFSIQPEFTLRHRWTAGSLAMWDNIATQHYAVSDYTDSRVFHRAMIRGGELPGRLAKWPVASDYEPRTLVIKGGAVATIGAMSEAEHGRD